MSADIAGNKRETTGSETVYGQVRVYMATDRNDAAAQPRI
jgi:hypothetical protein